MRLMTVPAVVAVVLVAAAPASAQATGYIKWQKFERSFAQATVEDKPILVYCGDGRVELAGGPGTELTAEVHADTMRQVDAVECALSETLRMDVATYTSATSPQERDYRLREFSRGRIQALVAIRCVEMGH